VLYPPSRICTGDLPVTAQAIIFFPALGISQFLFLFGQAFSLLFLKEKEKGCSTAGRFSY